MFTVNSTIDYSIEVHTLDAHKTSAAPNMDCYSSAKTPVAILPKIVMVAQLV